MSAEKNIPASVIARLPRYHRYLRELICTDVRRISSLELSRIMRVTPSQIRQDLGYFGGFGQQGYGYNVKYVYTKICDILGVTGGFTAVIIGIGNLGRALADDKIFEKHGVELIGLFDCDKEIIGSDVAGFEVYDIACISEFCKKRSVDIAVLTVPRTACVSVAAMIAELGVKGIWNFTGEELISGKNLPDCSIALQNVYLGDSFLSLCFDVKKQKESDVLDDKNGKEELRRSGAEGIESDEA